MSRSDERRAALANIAAFLAFGAAFVLLGLVTRSTTPLYRALCWQTSTVGFFAAAAVTVWRHPVVWFPLVRFWHNRLRQKKAKPAPGY